MTIAPLWRHQSRHQSPRQPATQTRGMSSTSAAATAACAPPPPLRSEIEPSITAQNIRRAKGFVWDHKSQTFKPAADVAEQPVTSSTCVFHRERQYVRDDTGWCWYWPPMRRDAREFRNGGGNYFKIAKSSAKAFKVGDFVAFSETEGDDDGLDAIGQISCLWEGFPQSAKISRWVEIRWLRPLTFFAKLGEAFRLKHPHAARTDLVLTQEFDAFPLTVLRKHVAIKFVARQHSPASTVTKVLGPKGLQDLVSWTCPLKFDEEKQQISWLDEVPSAKAVLAISQQYNFTAQATESDAEYLPWSNFFRYDFKETTTGKIHRSLTSQVLKRSTTAYNPKLSTLPFYEGECVICTVAAKNATTSKQGVIHRIRVLKQFKDHSTAFLFMYKVLRKYQDIYILSFDRNTSRVMWNKATVVGLGAAGEDGEWARVRYHATNMVRRCKLAGRACEFWAFAQPAPPTRICRPEDHASTPPPSEYRSCGLVHAPCLDAYRAFVASNASSPTSQIANGPKLDMVGFYGEGRPTRRRRIWRRRSTVPPDHKSTTEALRNVRTVELDDYDRPMSAEIVSSTDPRFLPHHKLPLHVQHRAFSFLSLRDVLACALTSKGGLRFCDHFLPAVASEAHYLLHGHYFPRPLRPSETPTQAFAFKYWQTRAQGCHGVCNKDFAACGATATFFRVGLSGSAKQEVVYAIGSNIPGGARITATDKTGGVHFGHSNAAPRIVKIATVRHNLVTNSSGAAHKPPLALLMSDGSVYTNSQKGWHIVRGLTKKKNRIIDVSVRGEGSSHRLMAVSTEGLIYEYALRPDIIFPYHWRPCGPRTGLRGEHVLSIACGHDFVAILTRQGKLRARGNLSTPLPWAPGVRPRTASDSAYLLSAPSFELGSAEELAQVSQNATLPRFSRLAAGATHLLVASIDNTLFVAGTPEFGKLGFDLPARDHSGHRSVVQVQHPAACHVTSIAAGSHHSLFVSRVAADGIVSDNSSGFVYGMGSNSDGQLGFLPQSASCTSHPTLLTLLAKGNFGNVVCVCAGSYHSVVHCSGGSFASFGRGVDGQLGHFEYTGAGLVDSLASPANKPRTDAPTQRFACSRCGALSSADVKHKYAAQQRYLKLLRSGKERAAKLASSNLSSATSATTSPQIPAASLHAAPTTDTKPCALSKTPVPRAQSSLQHRVKPALRPEALRQKNSQSSARPQAAVQKRSRPVHSRRAALMAAAVAAQEARARPAHKRARSSAPSMRANTQGAPRSVRAQPTIQPATASADWFTCPFCSEVKTPVGVEAEGRRSHHKLGPRLQAVELHNRAQAAIVNMARPLIRK